MRVKILGSAAGGGFPQWNCACRNCCAVRTGSFHGKARTQAQVAVSSDEKSWFLLGASPDLRAQIEAAPELHPRNGIRQSPIAGAILANADLDHVLGLLLLRELQPLRIYSTASVGPIVRADNSFFKMLNRVPEQASWTTFNAGETFPLCTPDGTDSGLRCRSLSLGSHFPAYVSPERHAQLNANESSLGLILGPEKGKRLAYVPAVPQINDALLQALDSCDLVLFDGTFWSDDELIRVQGSGQTSRQMGHVPVSSPDGSLSRLAGIRHPRKIYLHINNTNPMLDESGPEFRQVCEAGWQIAEDGWQFDL
ncbi:MAG TPA: pyrroloquinoline quinone biosynthesis protein PqqB [Candidatus Sulfotelmatobacter sp.]|nr:pyrroloquinoline quinone biosynthesis protein PqqB [Candidatus Sulfotelmatobacter sp.]